MVGVYCIILNEDVFTDFDLCVNETSICTHQLAVDTSRWLARVTLLHIDDFVSCFSYFHS